MNVHRNTGYVAYHPVYTSGLSEPPPAPLSPHADHLPEEIRTPLASLALIAAELQAQLALTRQKMLALPLHLPPYLLYLIETIVPTTLSDLNTSIATLAQSATTYITNAQNAGTQPQDFQPQVDAVNAVKTALDTANAALPTATPAA